MAAEAGGDERAAIGTRLKAAREKKGLTILQAAEKMHVDPRILESLEAENFAALGAVVYVKGHMRHYAELVGEQPAELQELYATSARAAPVQPDLTRISRARPGNDPAKLTGPAVIVLVAIAAIGALWWILSAPSEKPVPTLAQESARSEAAGSPDATGSREQPTGGEAAATATVGSQTPALQGSRRNQQEAGSRPGSAGKVAKSASSSTKSAASLTAGPVAHPGPVSTNTAAAVTPTVARAAANSGAAVSSHTAPLPTRTKQGELTLKFSSDSWAEVYDASGQRLFYDVGAASSAHTVKGPAPMRVVLGNASGVALEYNGRPAHIPASVLPDGSVHFVINAHGRAVVAAEGN
jgi:cytoskeleton protein RodZ